MEDQDGLRPRPGPAPRLLEGPRTGQTSLYQQRVLDEDTYTEALSTIISRDFFPNLPHLHATNAYLTALKENDPELLSSSIRRLAALAQAREGGHDDARARELANVGTPYMNVPGGSRPTRTPVGARGWDTPVDPRRRTTEMEAGPSREGPPPKKVKRVRDDLPLDAFQANYTSEDNASFVQIVDAENRQRKEEKWGWAWEAERKAEIRRLEGEEKRKMILDAATSAGWMVDGDGRRLIGGLGEGGRDRPEGEAWKEVRMIEAGPAADHARESVEGETSSTALVRISASGALVKRVDDGPPSGVMEQAIPEGHPLRRALAEAGLPATAFVSAEDGAIVPHREFSSGEGDGRGRGDADRVHRGELEKRVMGGEESGQISLGGSGVDQWPYKAMNNFMFPADANSKPYPPAGARPAPEAARGGPKAINHASTRLPEEEEAVGSKASSSRRGTSPSRSFVDAAVRGTPYRPGGNEGPRVGIYSLLPTDASPSPSDLPSLLTWGTLLATPRALDGGDDPLDGPSFTLPDTKRRDDIGRKLGDKASRSMNERAKGFIPRDNSTLRGLAGRTPRSTAGGGDRTPGGMGPPATPKRRDDLTPAAQKLLERSLGVGGRARGAAMDKSAGWGKSSSTTKMTWTPSPAHRR